MAPQTNRERMLAGESYNCLDPDLETERQEVKAILRRFNRSDHLPVRRSILEALLGQLGRDSIIEAPFHCTYGCNTYIGDHSYLNYSCVVLDNNEVRIGNHVMIGPAVQIYTAAHPIEAKPRIQGWEVAKPITIADSVWIAGGAILLPGVCIGRNAVVGAGAVVSRDVPANTVVAGSPARVIRTIDQSTGVETADLEQRRSAEMRNG